MFCFLGIFFREQKKNCSVFWEYILPGTLSNIVLFFFKRIYFLRRSCPTVYTIQRPSAGPEAGLLTFMVVCIRWCVVAFFLLSIVNDSECQERKSVARAAEGRPSGSINMKLSIEVKQIFNIHREKRNKF